MKNSNLNNNKMNNDYKLELLTPLDKKDDERVAKYLKHINEAIEREEVKNLALTGVYGSGKSTIIKSYKCKYPDKKFLNISLASFDETDKYDCFKDQIQLTILQQILYSQGSEKLPDSRINRIREIDVWNKNHIYKVLVLLAFVISTYSLLKFFTHQLNPNNWDVSLGINSFSWWCSIFVIIFLSSSFFIAQFIIKALSNSKINKVNVKGEIGVADDVKHKDFLNKYIDEILYFFEKVPTDVVVIEDLDRFNSTEIYRTLREVNFILNNYLKNTKQGKYKKVMFLYAIKDDLFSNELERTKFFDLIIPTIPFVNYSNSKNVLTKKLEAIYNEDDLFNNPNGNKDFINTVSAFITDNRILVNIINEFIVYKEQQKLQKEEFNQEKLLALVVYKNLRPKDFSRLHKSSSNIDIVFSNQNKLIENSIDELNNKISKAKEKIIEIRTENLKSIAELNTIFLYHLKENIGNVSVRKIIINSQEKSLKLIIDNGIDLSPLYDEEIKYIDNSGYTRTLNITFDDIDTSVGYEYSEKYNVIVNKDILIEEKEKEISEFENSIKELQNESLSQVLKKKDLSKESLKEEFELFYKESEITEEKERAYNDALLLFLLENGYIDEHYRDYISTFQKGGLTENDQEFKINIISRINEPKPLDYELTNISDIVEELPISYFKENRILNISLLDFLVVHRYTYTDKFKALLQTISKWNNKRTKQFFNLYINHSRQKEQFINELAKNWKDLWNKIQSDTSYLEKDKKQLLFLTINNLDNDTLISQNKKKALSNYISNDVELFYNHNFLVDLDRIQEVFSDDVLNIKFEELIPVGDKYKEKFEFIIKQNRYVLSYNNIGTILDYHLDTDFDKKEFDNSNLSYLYNSNITDVISYIEDDNYNTYIQNVYPKLDNIQNEDEDNILKVLNKKGLLKKNVSIFLNKQENKINNLYDLENLDHFSLVFEQNSIEASWDNIYAYYFENDSVFDKTLIKFLNEEENYSYLSTSTKIDIKVEKELKDEFIEKLISNNDLKIESYSVLMTCVPTNFELSDEFDFKLINDEKVEVLIQEKIVELNTTTFNSIKEIHPDLHIELLVNNQVKYLEYIKDNEIDIEDKTLTLQHSQLSNKNKLELVNKISIIDINSNEELSEEVCDLILETKSSNLPIEKIEALLKHNLTTEQKVNLIVLYSSKLTKQKIVEILKTDLPNSYNAHPRSQMMLSDDYFNNELAQILQNKGVAGKFKKAKNNKIRIWLNNFV